jgi:hypothetical protein
VDSIWPERLTTTTLSKAFSELLRCLHSMVKPLAALDGPRGALVLDEIPPVASIARVVEELIPRNHRELTSLGSEQHLLDKGLLGSLD